MIYFARILSDCLTKSERGVWAAAQQILNEVKMSLKQTMATRAPTQIANSFGTIPVQRENHDSKRQYGEKPKQTTTKRESKNLSFMCLTMTEVTN